MSMMLTFRAGKVAALAVGLSACLSIGACSREQQDWRAAEAADSVESYDQFLERHPDSELVTAARTRLAQLTEDREWQQAGNTDTPQGYREFLAHHPNGKWAQEARIRIQNFALNGLSAPGTPQVEVAGTAASQNAGALGTGTAALPSAGGPGKGSAASLSAGGPGTGSAASLSAGGPGTGSAASLSPGEPGTRTAASLSAGAPGTGNVRLASAASVAADTVPMGNVAAPAAAPRPAIAAPAAAGELAQPSAGPTANQLSTPYISAPRHAESVGGPLASPAPTTSSSGYAIQLGAFASETAATAAWQQLATRFGVRLQGLAPHVIAANTTNGTLFRLQAQVADESRARSLCDMLKRESQACVPVLPH
jgi:cell division septation protein DedD